MRQVRRGRILHIGILFLIYSCLYVYSAKIKSSTEEEINEDQTSPQIELNMSPNPTFNTDFYTTSKEESDMVELTTRETPHITHHHAHPTWRPKRTNCTPPAIEQFPQPLMGPNARKHGGLVIHVIVAIFTFLGLAIVCDDYFVSSLDRICEELKLSPDVAGATFMAAGSSAPELATVVIGVFFAKDDIGVSGVIGSAVFNIMFVISVCALCSGTVCQLNWWPLVRDCFFYSVSILVMLIIIFNDVISWVEALIMLIFYVFYCIALHFNTALERWAQTWKLPIKLPTREEQSALVTYKNISDPTYTQNAQAVTNLSQEPQEQPKPDEQSHIYDANASWDPNAAWGEESTGGGGTYGTAATTTTGGWDDAGQQSANSWDPNSTWEQGEGQQNYGYNRDGAEQNMQETNIGAEGGANVGNVAQTQQITSYYKSAEPKNTEPINPLEKPTTGGTPALIAWGIVFPIHYMCRLTMPDCRLEKYRNWYPFTFLISMIWISFYSYFMVWMITIIGATLGIPDTVMGLTFVAAGVSVPDALSSIAVIKEGYGDMAVSNAIGSNVFDILICLGLPWFIQTAIIKPGSHVNVISKGLAYSTLSLLSTVIFLLVATHLNGWKLDKRLGIVLMVWYLIFITLASLYELNVFGQLNPPECASNY